MQQLLLLAVFSLFALAIGQGPTYTNPVVDSNHPDPGVFALEDGSGFVVVSTSNYNFNNDGPVYPIMFSTDLVNWKTMSYVFPQDSWPVWASGDMWAPEIHRVNNNYHIYFSARNKDTNQLSIGVARSLFPDNPFGPYEDLGRPLIEAPNGVIDVSWFRDPKTNIPYLLWIGYSIMIRQIAEDGITFDDSWPTVTIMSADHPEDQGVSEGPSLIYREPFYYLLFSGDGFLSPYYHVTAARSLEVNGEYIRYEGEQFLHLDADRFEAGENCTFVGAGHGTPVRIANTDQYWYVYHTWRYDLLDVNPPGRVLNLDRITWTEDGWPRIGTPSDVPVPVPETM
jgi:beta-xylosidase